MGSKEPHAQPMAIPEPTASSSSSPRPRSGSLSALLSSFSPRSPTSASNMAYEHPTSLHRYQAPSSPSTVSEATEPATPRDVSPVYSDRGLNRPNALRDGVFGLSASAGSTKPIQEEGEFDDSSEIGYLGGGRAAAYHAATRRASSTTRDPCSAPNMGADFGTSAPSSLMNWVQNLSSTSPRSKAAPLPLSPPPPLDTHSPVDSGSTPPASSNLGMLFRRMSLGSAPQNARPNMKAEPSTTTKPIEAATTLPDSGRGRESLPRQKPAPRRLSPTSERMLRGVYNDLS